MFSPAIHNKGARSTSLFYDGHFDLLIVTKKTNQACVKDLFEKIIQNLDLNQFSNSYCAATPRIPHLWVFQRTPKNHVAYYDENRANVLFFGSSQNTIVAADRGVVAIYDVSDIVIKKTRKEICVYDSSCFDRAILDLAKHLQGKDILYKRPEHLIKESKTILTEDKIKAILHKYYRWEVR